MKCALQFEEQLEKKNIEFSADMEDRFYQGDTSHSTEGNGLGLALMERIRYLSDGSISVKVQFGEGSVFIVRLPVSQAAYE